MLLLEDGILECLLTSLVEVTPPQFQCPDIESLHLHLAVACQGLRFLFLCHLLNAQNWTREDCAFLLEFWYKRMSKLASYPLLLCESCLIFKTKNKAKQRQYIIPGMGHVKLQKTDLAKQEITIVFCQI